MNRISDTSSQNKFPPQGVWALPKRQCKRLGYPGVQLVLIHSDSSQLRWLRHIPPGGAPDEDPGHVGGTLFLGCPGNS